MGQELVQMRMLLSAFPSAYVYRVHTGCQTHQDSREEINDSRQRPSRIHTHANVWEEHLSNHPDKEYRDYRIVWPMNWIQDRTSKVPWS